MKKPTKEKNKEKKKDKSRVTFDTLRQVNGEDQEQEKTRQDILNEQRSKEKKRKKAEPFIYNHESKREDKDQSKKVKKSRLGDFEQTLGASIETLDFSDNDLNDKCGEQILTLINS